VLLHASTRDCESGPYLLLANGEKVRDDVVSLVRAISGEYNGRHGVNLRVAGLKPSHGFNGAGGVEA